MSGEGEENIAAGTETDIPPGPFAIPDCILPATPAVAAKALCTIVPPTYLDIFFNALGLVPDRLWTDLDDRGWNDGVEPAGPRTRRSTPG
jgi:hypothetical protein